MNPVTVFVLLTMLGLLFIAGLMLTFKLRGIAW